MVVVAVVVVVDDVDGGELGVGGGRDVEEASVANRWWSRGNLIEMMRWVRGGWVTSGG